MKYISKPIAILVAFLMSMSIYAGQHPTVDENNPNFFTYIHYGNNLDLNPSTDYANQFRISAGGSYADITPTPTTDAPKGVSLQYTIRVVHQGGGSKIDKSTGKIKFANIKEAQTAILVVTATAGKGTPNEFSVNTPIFVNKSAKIVGSDGEKVLAEFTPFVLQVNPNTGGKLPKPSIKGVKDLKLVTMEYRRTFIYHNYNGPESQVDGQPNVEGSFLNKLWGSYFGSINKPTNVGSKDPMSYYSNKKRLELPLAYIDPATLEVVVNPNKWIYDGEPASGFVIGQIPLATNGEDPSAVGQEAHMFPIVLWFSTQFK